MLTIQQVSQKLKLSKHTLRFWEKALHGVLVPFRTEGGQRRYGKGHILLLQEIKRLKNRGFSLEDIRSEILKKQHLVNNGVNPDFATLDILTEHIAETVRSSIYRFFERINSSDSDHER